MMRLILGVFLLMAALALVTPVGAAEEVVTIGGARALLDKPPAARAGLIIVPGGDGYLNISADGRITRLAGNQLVRTRAAYRNAGLAVLTVDAGVDLGAAVQYMRGIVRSVTIVATSRGTVRLAQALAAGVRPDGAVFTAGFMQQVQSILGSPGNLPRTLVVHHRLDTCRFTLPDAVEPFRQWGGAKVRVVWLTGGRSEGNVCDARAYHGFNGIDGSVVAAVASFARSAR
jgi:hypothetical protein